jgi:hypothetical protein
MKKLNLLNKRFHRLTVVEECFGYETAHWKCICDCGKERIVSRNYLMRGTTRSCGCLTKEINESRRLCLLGQRFRKLKVIKEQEKGMWLCKCDCGGSKIVPTGRLRNKSIISCGCIRRKSKNKREAIARRIWSNVYSDSDLSFERFLEKSQLNCHYCGIIPSRVNKEFVYNGLDRIDNSKGHTDENTVPCCTDCNYSKRDRSLDDFKLWVGLIYNHLFENNTKKDLNNNINNIEYSNIFNHGNRKRHPAESTARGIWKRRYNDSNLTFEQFFKKSQLNCYYCNNTPENKQNLACYDKRSSKEAIRDGYFIYNGLDRLDNNKAHSDNNTVPCCWHCNYSKRDKSFEEFKKWVSRLHKNLYKK